MIPKPVKLEPSPWNEPENDPDTPPVTDRDPTISESVFTLNPSLGEIEALTEPEAIWDKFRPTIPEAGMPVSPAPDPSKDPEARPALLTVNRSVPPVSTVKAVAPVDTEAVTAPDLILSKVKSPAVVMGWPFNVAVPIN